MKRYIVLAVIALSLLFTPHTHAAISLDSTSSFGFATRTTATTTIVVHSGSNEALVLCVSTNAATANSSTVNGVSMTKLTFLANSTKQATFFYLPSAPVGTDLVSTTFSGTTPGGMVLSSYFGVNQNVTFEENQSTGNGSLSSVSSSVAVIMNNDWVVDCSAKAANNTTGQGTGQTVIAEDLGSTNMTNSSYISATTANTAQSTSYTFSGNNLWVINQGSMVPAIVQTSTIALLGVATSSATGVTQISTSFVSPSTANGILFVYAGTTGLTGTVSTATYNGVVLTRLGNMIGLTNAAASIFYMLNPPVGTFTASTSFSTSGAGFIAVSEYSNVNQATPFDSTSTLDSPTLTANSLNYISAAVTTTLPNDMGVDFVMEPSSGALNVPDLAYQTTNYNAKQGVSFSYGGSSEVGQSNTSVIQMGWIETGAQGWIGLALETASNVVTGATNANTLTVVASGQGFVNCNSTVYMRGINLFVQ